MFVSLASGSQVRILCKIYIFKYMLPASVAQSDVCLTGDQEVVVRSMPGLAPFFHVD